MIDKLRTDLWDMANEKHNDDYKHDSQDFFSLISFWDGAKQNAARPN